MEQKQDEGILPQAEAYRLIAVRKQIISPEQFKMSNFENDRKTIKLASDEPTDSFVIDVEFKRRRNSLKGKCQLRSRRTVRLLRLDSNGSRHLNPDGSKVGQTHMHLYKEGDSDRWGYELPKNMFTNLDDAATTLREFLKYCNVQYISINGSAI